RRAHRWRQFYRKVGTRRAQAISKICIAGAVDVDAGGVIVDVRLAFGSVAPTPVRARAAEDRLRGRPIDARVRRAARDALSQDLAPMGDRRSTARYRQIVAARLLGEMMRLRDT